MIRMDQFRDIRADKARGIIAADVEDRGRDIADDAIGIEMHDDVADVIGQQAIPRLAFRQFAHLPAPAFLLELDRQREQHRHRDVDFEELHPVAEIEMHHRHRPFAAHRQHAADQRQHAGQERGDDAWRPHRGRNHHQHREQHQRPIGLTEHHRRQHGHRHHGQNGHEPPVVRQQRLPVMHRVGKADREGQEREQTNRVADHPVHEIAARIDLQHHAGHRQGRQAADHRHGQPDAEVVSRQPFESVAGPIGVEDALEHDRGHQGFPHVDQRELRGDAPPEPEEARRHEAGKRAKDDRQRPDAAPSREQIPREQRAGHPDHRNAATKTAEMHGRCRRGEIQQGHAGRPGDGASGKEAGGDHASPCLSQWLNSV